MFETFETHGIQVLLKVDFVKQPVLINLSGHKANKLGTK